MAGTRKNYKERCVDILKVLKSSECCLTSTEIHEKIKQNTGETISKSTLTKCLVFLHGSNQIEKIKVKGPGNPFFYTVRKAPVCVQFTKHIESYKEFERKYRDEAPLVIEVRQYREIGFKIVDLIGKLLIELEKYSTSGNKGEASVDYDNYIDFVISPLLKELKTLAEFKISGDTSELMERILYDNLIENLIKNHHPRAGELTENDKKIISENMFGSF